MKTYSKPRGFFSGFLLALTICSIALNVAQYTGKLGSPQIVKLQPSDQQKVANIFNGGNS